MTKIDNADAWRIRMVNKLAASSEFHLVRMAAIAKFADPGQVAIAIPCPFANHAFGKLMRQTDDNAIV